MTKWPTLKKYVAELKEHCETHTKAIEEKHFQENHVETRVVETQRKHRCYCDNSYWAIEYKRGKSDVWSPLGRIWHNEYGYYSFEFSRNDIPFEVLAAVSQQCNAWIHKRRKKT